MNQEDLDAAQRVILDLYNEAYQPIQYTSEGYQLSTRLDHFALEDLRVIHSGRFATHEEVRTLVDRIELFYSVATPAEIRLLNTRAQRCKGCGNDYTDEDYPTVHSMPKLKFIEFHDWHPALALTTTAYCQQCIYHMALKDPNRARPGMVYVVECEDGFKIGRSKDTEARMKKLRREYGATEIRYEIECGNNVVAEGHLQSLFLHRHVKGEVFNLQPVDLQRIAELAS